MLNKRHSTFIILLGHLSNRSRELIKFLVECTGFLIGSRTVAPISSSVNEKKISKRKSLIFRIVIIQIIIIIKMGNVLTRTKNHVSDFSDFYFSRYGENSSKIDNLEYKNYHISKTKNLKIDFSFVSAHFASFM